MPAATPQCLICDEVSPESCIQPQWQRKIQYTSRAMQISTQLQLAPFSVRSHNWSSPAGSPIPLIHLHPSDTKSDSLHSTFFANNTHCFLHLTFTFFCCICFLVNKTHCITKDRKQKKIWHSWDLVKSLPPTISLVIYCIKRQTGRFKYFKSNTNMDSDPTNYASNLHI